MSKPTITGIGTNSDLELARTVARIAEAAGAQVIICVTETGEFARHFMDSKGPCRIVAATATSDTYDALVKAGQETVRLPLHASDRHRQIRHVLFVALKTRVVSIGELVVCVTGQDAYPGEPNVVVVTEAEPSLEELVITDLVKLTDGIQPAVLECAVAVACKVGRAAQRGKRIGAILVLGDSLKVLQGSRQLIPNPFEGHADASRRITNPEIQDSLVELSKLDGAFVVRGDGFIQTAATFLANAESEVELAIGLGARHVAAAATTARTAATAIVVSATDGNVRVFSGGRMVLKIDPAIEHGPIHGCG